MFGPFGHIAAFKVSELERNRKGRVTCPVCAVQMDWDCTCSTTAGARASSSRSRPAKSGAARSLAKSVTSGSGPSGTWISMLGDAVGRWRMPRSRSGHGRKCDSGAAPADPRRRRPAPTATIAPLPALPSQPLVSECMRTLSSWGKTCCDEARDKAAAVAGPCFTS